MTDDPHPKKGPIDEAESIRRFSRGDCMNAAEGGSNAKASIEGGFWIALIAMIIALMALYVSWSTNQDLLSTTNQAAAAAIAAAERADRASATTALAREYVVTTYAEIQSEFAKRDMSIKGPMGHHRPVSDETYQEWDDYVTESISADPSAADTSQ